MSQLIAAGQDAVYVTVARQGQGIVARAVTSQGAGPWDGDRDGC